MPVENLGELYRDAQLRANAARDGGKSAGELATADALCTAGALAAGLARLEAALYAVAMELRATREPRR